MIVELQLNLPGIEKVHLEELIVSMRLHITAKKLRHAGKRLIVHIPGAQTLFILGTDVDIGNHTLAHNVGSLRRGAWAGRFHRYHPDNGRPSTSSAATNHNPLLKLPVTSFSQPIINGLSADPMLPVALITAMPIALARRLMD